MAFRLRRVLLCALLAMTAWLADGTGRAAETYTFAVVPQFEQRKLFAIWKPVVDEIVRRTGLDLRLIATLSIPEFETELEKGTFDFVYTNPYHTLHVYPRQGYIPLVRDAVPLTGIVVVAKDSRVRSLADLDGKVLAIPSPNALGASLLVRAELDRAHVRMTILDAKTHSSVYLHVANGLADAGGGVQKSLQEQPEMVQAALRILFRTREMPSHPISAHPRVPVAAREAVRAALLAMAKEPAGRALLAEIPMAEPVPASIADYQAMSDWGLERYWVDRTPGK